MGKPLRVSINELIVRNLERKLAAGDEIDVAAMTFEMAQCLVDVIMQQEEEGQGSLFAYALTSLCEDYLQRRGEFDTKIRGH
jgi:hypothetical protein